MAKPTNNEEDNLTNEYYIDKYYNEENKDYLEKYT